MLATLLVMSALAADPATDQSCSLIPPQGYVVGVGWASGKQARALVDAQDMARNRLMAQICDGQSSARCDAIRPHVRDWDPTWDKDSRTACALAAVDGALVDGLQADLDQLEQDLQLLAGAITSAASGTVYLAPPSPPGVVSDVLELALQNALSTTPTVLATADAADERVELDIVQAGGFATVAARLGKDTTWRALPGFRVALDVFGVEDVAETRSDARVLTLEVTALAKDGRLLRSGSEVHSGDKFTVTATVSQPAFMYVVYENSAGEEQLVDRAGQWAKPGVAAQLPRPGFHFTVDDNAGRTELVHVIATPEPLPDDLTSGIATAYQIKRGLTVDQDASAAGRARLAGDPVSVASGYGGVVVTLSLDHR